MRLIRAEELPIGSYVNLYDLGMCEVTSHEDGIVCFRLLEGEEAGKFAAFQHDDTGPFETGTLN